MIPDLEKMSVFVGAMESFANGSGWDCDPMFGLVLRANNVELSHARDIVNRRALPEAKTADDAYGLMPYPIQPNDIGPQTVVAMKAIAETVKVHGLVPSGFAVDRAGDFIGVIFICEAWESTLPPEERDGRKIADIPGSVESRNVYAIDAGGHVYWTKRIRGQQPENYVDGEEGAVITGDLIEALREIMLAAADQLPEEIDVEAVKKIGIRGE